MLLFRCWKAIVPFFVMMSSAHFAAGQSQLAPISAETLDLNRILAEVIAGNPNLDVARLRTQAARTVDEKIAALPDPTVMASVFPFPIYTARGTQRSQLRVEQMIPYPGKTRLQRQIAEMEESVSTQSFLALEFDLSLSAKFAYYDLVRLSEQEKILDEFENHLSDFERIASTKYEVGVGTQQAVLKAQLERNQLSDRRLEIQRSQATARERLANLMHRPLGDDFVLEIDDSVSYLTGAPTETLIQIAANNRPELVGYDVAIDQTVLRTQLAKKDLYPDFGVSLTYFDIADSAIPPTSDGKDALALGFSIKVPLHRSPLRAAVEEIQITERRLDSEREALVSNIETDISDLRQQILSDDARRRLFSESLIPKAVATVSATLSAYSTDRADFLALLDAERMLFELKMMRQDARGRMLQTIARLERVLAVRKLSDIQSN